MMGAIQNSMRLQAQRATAESMVCRNGQITSYDPDNFAVKVQLQPEGTVTGWLPLTSAWIGNGWGMFAAPSIGDMVVVEFIDGNYEAGFVTQRFFNDEDRPLPVPASEFWLVHKSGSLLKFHNDGTVELTAQSDLTITVGGDLTADVTGDATVTVGGDADLSVSGDATADITGNLDISAAEATVTATTTTIDGALVVNGATTLNGSITQGSGGGSTNAHLIGPLTVDDDVTAQGTSVHGHRHGGVQTGGGTSGTPV